MINVGTGCWPPDVSWDNAAEYTFLDILFDQCVATSSLGLSVCLEPSRHAPQLKRARCRLALFVLGGVPLSMSRPLHVGMCLALCLQQ